MLHDWTNLFMITGAAGAQLIGLLFVAITLGAGLSTSQSVDGVRAFMTPILINLSSVLFQAMVVLTPWPSAWPMGVILALAGLAGLAYHVHTIRLQGKVDFASLNGIDWIAHNGFPVIADLSLIGGGAGFIADKSFAPYAVAAASTLLLVAGIYGVWDLTLWMVKNRRRT
jgi:hypothetical protein